MSWTVQSAGHQRESLRLAYILGSTGDVASAAEQSVSIASLHTRPYPSISTPTSYKITLPPGPCLGVQDEGV